MTRLEALGLLVATLGGTAVGLERQRSGHAVGPDARFAGIRTFTMLGALAGLSGWLWTSGVGALAAIVLAGAVAMTVAAYIAASARGVDGTTEIAALIVLAAGVLAGMGALRLASGIVAIEVLLLVEKTRLHALVGRIDDVEFRTAVRFAVMALVILPLLPEGPYGPFGGIRPRELWLLVLFFSGLSFAGHLMRRLLGAQHGYLLSGIAGGLLSSTNVTLTFARASRQYRSMDRALALGAVAANAVLYLRVTVAVAVLNPELVRPLVPYLIAPAVAVMAAAVVITLRTTSDGAATPAAGLSDNPLQLWSALQMAALFQLVLMVVSAARDAFGQAGVLTTAAVLGLTDVDALTVSMARGVAATSLSTAALAIAVGVLANTLMKAAIAVAFGTPTFRVLVAGTLIVAAMAGAAVLLT